LISGPMGAHEATTPPTAPAQAAPTPRHGRGLALALAIAASLAAAVALSLAAAGPALLPGDLVIAQAIQGARLPSADGAARALTLVGGTIPALLLALAGIAWLVGTGHRAAAFLVALAAACRAATPLLKGLFSSPRPSADLVTIVEQADGFGFPSGHALGAVLLYGSFWLVAPAILQPGWPVRAARAAALAMIVLTGLARVRVGAHWPSDVLGGFLWGLLLLTVIALASDRVASRTRSPHTEPIAGSGDKRAD
jgi:undecaprenyl-diphosphatase